MGHHHEIPIRYGEVDIQRVVFNAHYLAFLDDAVDHWLRELHGDYESIGFDFMVKRADLVWHGSAGLGDTLEIESAVSRWGTTSFDVTHQLHVGDRDVMTAVTTYVSVTPGTSTPVAPPDEVRRFLGDATG